MVPSRGVDDPTPGRALAVVSATFFGQDGVAGALSFERLYEQGLTGTVDFRHQIHGGALGPHLDLGLVALPLESSGLARQALGDLEDATRLVLHATSGSR